MAEGRKRAAPGTGDAVLLHVPDREQFRAIAASPRLRPFVLGSPGHNWLFMNETRKELAATLEGLGFTVIRELIHHEFPADGKPAETELAALLRSGLKTS